MPYEIRVSVTVETPDDEIRLTRRTEAAPRVHVQSQAKALNADNDAASAAALLGAVTDEVLGHFGYGDAFAQYVAISELLSGREPSEEVAEGVHVRRVRELLSDKEHLVRSHQTTSADLAWAVNPENWMVDLVHDRVGAVNDVAAPPRSDTYTDLTGRHGATTPLPANVLNHVSARLLDRIDDIVAMSGSGSRSDQVERVREIIHDTIAAEAEQAIFRTRVRLRPEPGAPAATAESPALFEQDRT